MLNRMKSWYWSYPLPRGKVFKREIIFQEHFVELVVKKIPFAPPRILALDIDEVLINFYKSQRENKPAIIHLAEIRELLILARHHKVPVVLITARKVVQEIKKHPASLAKLLGALNIRNFHSIVYTNHASKVHVMEYLYNQFLKPSFFFCQSLRHKICLVDDGFTNIRQVSSHGFDTIHVANTKDQKYLASIKEFILGKRSIEVPEYSHSPRMLG